MYHAVRPNVPSECKKLNEKERRFPAADHEYRKLVTNCEGLQKQLINSSRLDYLAPRCRDISVKDTLTCQQHTDRQLRQHEIWSGNSNLKFSPAHPHPKRVTWLPQKSNQSTATRIDHQDTHSPLVPAITSRSPGSLGKSQKHIALRKTEAPRKTKQEEGRIALCVLVFGTAC